MKSVTAADRSACLLGEMRDLPRSGAGARVQRRSGEVPGRCRARGITT